MNLGDARNDIGEFARTLVWYTSRKSRLAADHFEGAKGIVVTVLKARRGTYQKPFLHVGMVMIMVLAVGFAPLLLSQYPSGALATDSSTSGSSLELNQGDITNINTATKESDKPRRDVVNYTVKSGDTLSSIAKDYGVDASSIAYLNSFDSDSKVLKPGEEIKIPPVAGVIVTVKSGDTIYTLAKKFGLPTAEPIADYPYNSFANDEIFSLTVGQTLVIPGGKPPEEVPNLPAPQRTPSQNLLPSGLFQGGSGQFAWPTSGIITQRKTWYHTGWDIASNIGTNVFAADAGRVIEANCGWNGGYGCHILIDHGNGYITMYAHLSKIVASAGQDVGRGTNIGQMGSTGHSTGPHLHFEIRRGGAFLDPGNFLK